LSVASCANRWKSCASLAVCIAVHAWSVLCHCDVSWTSLKAFVLIEELFFLYLHATCAISNRVWTCIARWLARITCQGGLILDFNISQALFDACVSLKVGPLVAFETLRSSISTFHAVGITLQTLILWGIVVTRTLGQTLIIQEQTELRSRIACCTLTWSSSLTSQTWIIAVSRNLEACLRGHYFIACSCLDEYLERICWGSELAVDQSIECDLEYRSSLYVFACYCCDNNLLFGSIKVASSVRILIGELASCIDWISCNLRWILHYDFRIWRDPDVNDESKGKCSHDEGPSILIDHWYVLYLGPLSHLDKECAQIWVIWAYEGTTLVLDLRLEQRSRLCRGWIVDVIDVKLDGWCGLLSSEGKGH
jgi:hypothetical protein